MLPGEKIPMGHAQSAEKGVQDIRKTLRRFSAKENIRIVLEGLRGEEAATATSERRVTAVGR